MKYKKIKLNQKLNLGCLSYIILSIAILISVFCYKMILSNEFQGNYFGKSYTGKIIKVKITNLEYQTKKKYDYLVRFTNDSKEIDTVHLFYIGKSNEYQDISKDICFNKIDNYYEFAYRWEQYISQIIFSILFLSIWYLFYHLIKK